MTYLQWRDKVLNNPTSHFYLTNAIRVFESKDCVDAYYDAQLLADLMKARMKEALK